MFNYPGSPDPKVWAMKKDLDKAFGSIRAVEAKLDRLARSTLTLVVQLGSNGGSGTTASLVLVGFESKPLPACGATKAGHECKAWNTKADGSGKTYPVGSKIDWTAFGGGDELILYAVWTPCTYQIEYELDGGVNGEGNPSSYVYGTAVTLADASKDGKEFDGWYSDAEFTTEVTGIAATDTGDKKFYAKFVDPA